MKRILLLFVVSCILCLTSCGKIKNKKNEKYFEMCESHAKTHLNVDDFELISAVGYKAENGKIGFKIVYESVYTHTFKFIIPEDHDVYCSWCDGLTGDLASYSYSKMVNEGELIYKK